MILPKYLSAYRRNHSSAMRLISILVFFGIMVACPAAFSQCENSIKIEKVITDETTNKGIIEVAVKSSKEYVCVLSIQKGSGPQFVAERKGTGSGSVRFNNLDKNAIYQVEIEFTTEEKEVCKKLQKSLITFQ